MASPATRVGRNIVSADNILTSVADPGYPGSEFFHPGSASKILSILTPKKWFLSSQNIIRGVVYPGAGS
jgi:hypothetical protein